MLINNNHKIAKCNILFIGFIVICLALVFGFPFRTQAASVPANLPIITSIDPPSSPVGTNTPVTISGLNFGAVQGSSKVEFSWNNVRLVQASIISWNDTKIVCIPPGGINTCDAQHGVRVTTSAGTSAGFPFEVPFSYLGAKWGINPIKFYVAENSRNCQGIIPAIIKAAQTWNNVSNANIYLEYAGRIDPPDPQTYQQHIGNGINEVFFVDLGHKMLDEGAAFVCFTAQNGVITECDTIFDDYFPWTTDDYLDFSVERTGAHEFGHWLGLGDLYGELDRKKMMGLDNPSLKDGDIAGVRWIYPGTGTLGQYHIKITNNENQKLSMCFKTDVDTVFSPTTDINAGETVTTWRKTATAGSHTTSIKWLDPSNNSEHVVTSSPLPVQVESDTEYILATSPSKVPPTLPDQVIGTFGLNTSDDMYGEGPNAFNAMKFRNTVGTGNLNKLEIFFQCYYPSGKARLGVYADSSGQPGNLLMDAGEVNITDKWVSISNLILPVTLNTDYWLAFKLSYPNGLRYQAGQANNSHYRIPFNATYGVLPSVFPVASADIDNNQFVMRATVTVPQAQYLLNINAAPNNSGNVARSLDRSSYPSGQQIILTANAVNGFVFDSWNGDITGSINPTTITMDKNKNITANFKPAIGKITFTTNVQTIKAGSPSNVITIQSQDNSGNPMDVSSNSTVSLISTSSTGKFDINARGTFDGTASSIIIPAGSNSSSFYYMDTIAGNYSITANATGFNNAVQQQTIIPGTRAKLIWGTQPLSSVTAGTAWLPFSVKIADQYGNRTADTGDITIAPSSGTLNGVLTNNAIAGLATFNDISRNQRGNLTLTAISGSLSGTSASNTITVNPGSATHMSVETAANGSGGAIAAQNLNVGASLTVYGFTRDQFNNFIGNPSNTTWSLTSKTGGIVDSDLSPTSGIGATFTGHAAGTAVIQAINGAFSTDSGVITVATPAPPVRGGGGGGGSVSIPPPAPKPVGLSGLSSVADLNLDVYGRVPNNTHLTTEDGKVTLDIGKNTVLSDTYGAPLKSLSANILTSFPQAPPENMILLSYELGPEGSVFYPPITLTLTYDPQKLPEGVVGESISMAYWDGSKWSVVESKIDLIVGTVSTQISHFSQYALIAKYIPPAKFTLSDFKISPAEVSIGEIVVIQGVVSNSGGSSGQYKVVLKVNGDETENREITLEAGKVQSVSFTIKKDSPGDYTLDLNAQVGKFTVTAPLPLPEITYTSPVLTPQEVPISTPQIAPSTSSTPSNETKGVTPALWITLGITIIAIITALSVYSYRKVKSRK
jgi:hypothetical protein